MAKYAQILHGKAHWIFESDTTPQFAPNIVIVKITSAMGDVQEGWSYDEETKKFTPPEPHLEPEPVITVEEEILIETRYQTMLLEMTTLGGMFNE